MPHSSSKAPPAPASRLARGRRHLLAPGAAGSMAAAALLLSALPASAAAGAGSLDPSYGTNGSVSTASASLDPSATTANPGDNASGVVVAVQPDGKIVVVGTVIQGANNQQVLTVTRYNVDGTLDTSFGTGGTYVFAIAGDQTLGSAVALAPDGDIVVGGEVIENAFSTTAAPVFKSVLLELSPTGAPVSTFGVGGETLDSTGYHFADQFNALAVQSNGDIVAAGSNDNGWQVARFAPTGALDPTFADHGTLDFDPGAAESNLDNAEAVTIAPGGDIVVAGSASNLTAFGLVRLTPSGAFDSSFGTAGVVVTDPGSGTAASGFGVGIQPQGAGYDIIVGGDTTPAGQSSELAVQQFNSTGGLVNTALISQPGESLSGGSLIVDPDGSVVVGGDEANPANGVSNAILVARLTPSIALDSGFGTGGVTVAPISYDNDVTGIAAEPLTVDNGVGSFVVAGFDSTATGPEQLLTARFLQQAETGPMITTDPTSQVVSAGTHVTFTAGATGSPAPTVQWEVSTDGGHTFTAIPSATSDTYTFVATQSETNNQYQAVFTNPSGVATTSAATLTVTVAAVLAETPWPVFLPLSVLPAVAIILRRRRKAGA